MWTIKASTSYDLYLNMQYNKSIYFFKHYFLYMWHFVCIFFVPWHFWYISHFYSPENINISSFQLFIAYCVRTCIIVTWIKSVLHISSFLMLLLHYCELSTFGTLRENVFICNRSLHLASRNIWIIEDSDTVIMCKLICGQRCTATKFSLFFIQFWIELILWSGLNLKFKSNLMISGICIVCRCVLLTECSC